MARIEKKNDLQAVMPVPKGHASSLYYKSKLNCINLTICDSDLENVDCYFWDETQAKRGSIEIGSCVLQYLNSLQKIENITNIDVIIHSDNCCGQQKNEYILSAYAYAVNKLSKITSITHKFLICGHTQNEGDNVHGVIEKQVKRHLKSSPIYIPQQYSTLIRASKKNGPPYIVHELSYEDFFHLKTRQEDWGNNFTVDTDNNQVRWHDIKVLRVDKGHSHSFFYKVSFEDEVYKHVNVRNVRKRSAAKFYLI
ncbi:hypothetical protein JTB14_026429 [Gonioctena quinquepunctata]|nr:hypothetical protein JTB14_026429 [Gonioctena quinquepunctata]